MEDNLLKGKITKALFLFSLPITLSMAASQFYSLADSLIVGMFCGKEALAAISNASSVLFFFLFISGGLELGSNLFIASIKGKYSNNQVNQVIVNLIFFDFIIGMILLVLGQVYLNGILKLIQTPSSIFRLASQYGHIYLIGLPFLMVYDLTKQIFIGYGDSKTPLVYVVISTAVNIVLDYYFIACLNLNVVGGAIATVIAQIVGVTLSLKRLYYHVLNKQLNFKIMDKNLIKHWFGLSLPSILQQMIAPISSMIKQGILGTLGVSAIAGFSVANTLLGFMIMPIAGVCQALVVFIAQNINAKQYERTRLGMKKSRNLLFIFTTLIILITSTFSIPLLSLFTKDKQALGYGCLILRYEPLFYYFFSLRNRNEAKMRGYQKMTYYLISSMFYLVVTLAGLSILVPYVGIDGFYLSTGLGNFVGMGLSYLLQSSYFIKKDA